MEDDPCSPESEATISIILPFPSIPMATYWDYTACLSPCVIQARSEIMRGGG